jgi:hypothetical protein
MLDVPAKRPELTTARAATDITNLLNLILFLLTKNKDEARPQWRHTTSSRFLNVFSLGSKSKSLEVLSLCEEKLLTLKDLG